MPNINVKVSLAKQFNVSMKTVDTILTPTVDNTLEIIKTGNNSGDDDNWRLTISGNKLNAEYREGGEWKFSGAFTRQ